MGGGGGGFGLFLDDAFSRGSTADSETYGNPPLCATPEFDVLNVECWGFTTRETAREADEEADAANALDHPARPALRTHDSH